MYNFKKTKMNTYLQNMFFIYRALKQNLGNSNETMCICFWITLWSTWYFLMLISLHQHLPYPALNKTEDSWGWNTNFANVKGMKHLQDILHEHHRLYPERHCLKLRQGLLFISKWIARRTFGRAKLIAL